MAEISIVQVTRNGMDYLPRCLASLRAQSFPDRELWIVDNGSSDGTAEYVRGLAEAKVLLLGSNTGFARANNMGIRGSAGKYVFVVNQDVYLEPSFLAELVRAMERDGAIGSACGKLMRMLPDGTRTDVIDSTGLILTRSRNVLKRGAGTVGDSRYDRPGYVFGACGSAVLYRRRMLEEVRSGDEFFDEDFFAYFEDADLSWRAQLRGWRCVYEPRAVGYHAGGSPVRDAARAPVPEAQRRRQMDYLLWRNRYLMIAKNDSMLEELRDLPWRLCFEAGQLPFLGGQWRSRLAGTMAAVRMLPKMLGKRRTCRPKGSPRLSAIWAGLREHVL